MSDEQSIQHRRSRPESVVLLDLGRSGATGAQRRIRSLVEVVRSIGMEPLVIDLLVDHATSRSRMLRRAPELLRRDRVPECVAWSPDSVRCELERHRPDHVVAVTSRAFHPSLLGPWRFYVDFVDRMSINYRARARLARRPDEQLLYRLLSNRHRWFEQRPPATLSGRLAAGHLDATELGAHWVPITATTLDERTDMVEAPDLDLLFVGTLDYLPNVAAVEQLDQLWPALQRRLPGLRVGIAGARPSHRVRRIVRRNGWTLIADFDSLPQVLSRTRIAVAPLNHATGMQIKVLDAAAAGIPQLVSPAAASGFDTQFPLLVCSTEQEWIDGVALLLQHPDRAQNVARSSVRHVIERYSLGSAGGRLRQALMG